MLSLFGPPSIERLKKKKAVRELIDIMSNDADPKRRADAIAALGELEDAIPLERMLINGPMKEEAAAALARMKRKPKNDIAARIHITLKEWDKIASIGHDAVNPLFDVAMTADERDATAAAAVLATMTNSYAETRSLDLLREGHDAVRQPIIDALLKKDDAAKILDVLVNLRPRETATRDAAKERLAQIRAMSAIDPLTKLLPQLLPDLEAGNHVARMKLEFLGWQPRTKAQRTMWLALDDSPQWDEIASLGKDAIAPLMSLLHRKDFTEPVMKTLARIGGPDVEKSLGGYAAALDDVAIEALMLVNPSTAVRALIFAAHNKHRSREAVRRLDAFIDKHGSSLSGDDLQLLANLDNTVLEREASIWEMASDPEGGLVPRKILQDVDCSSIRNRARKELDRRAS
jgi:hypothetical protein